MPRQLCCGVRRRSLTRRGGSKPKFNEIACPNTDCSDFDIKGKGNVTANGTYKTINGRVRKFICHVCGKVFSDRTNTTFYDLRMVVFLRPLMQLFAVLVVDPPIAPPGQLQTKAKSNGEKEGGQKPTDNVGGILIQRRSNDFCPILYTTFNVYKNVVQTDR
jgi:hypothetical protein